ncbi:MAG: DUF222 domain-containing protein [Propionibacterium sp.]|nr:DUF222 domain-containing protein [Propionibacterium sp.]
MSEDVRVVGAGGPTRAGLVSALAALGRILDVDADVGSGADADADGVLGRCEAVLADPARIDAIRHLEDLKNAACAAQAVLAVEFARSQKAEQARRGVPAERVGGGVAEQVALARRESPHAGAVFLGLATILVTEMPRTLQAMSRGVLSEYRARLVVQETSCLSREARAEIDRQVCGDLARLDTLGTRRLGNLVRGEAARRDPAGVTARLGHAAEERFVSLRPAPDCMTRLSALLPVAQGVSVLAALQRASDTARATGDPRTRGQVMADELVVRVTGQSSPDAIPIALHLIMPADSLLGEGVEPGWIAGHGGVPGPVARRLVGSAPRLGSWVRRLWAAPTGGLIAMESRHRLFPQGLGEFVSIRDDLCRTPYCDAPIRHIDHIVAKADGGETSAANGQGLCERCNHAKQALGWSEVNPHHGPDDDPPEREDAGTADRGARGRRFTDPTCQVTITTPTGHHYLSPDTDTA